MTALEPITGTVLAKPPRPSSRDIRAYEWDQASAWKAAVDIWLLSVAPGHSRDAYRRDITLWRNWCDENDVPLDDVRRGDVNQWREDLTGAPATIARRMSAVSSFYSYWLDEGIVTRNPVHKANRPQVSSKPKSKPLSLMRANILLSYVDGLSDPRPGVITRLLAETGMRVGELCGASAADLAESGTHHVLLITRKGQDEPQQVPIADATHHLVREYLDGRTDGWLIAVKRSERREGDGRMDRSYVRQLLRRLARESGLPVEVWTKMHPHVLRHSAATIMYASNVAVPEIQRVLGHASIETTMRYIHLAKELDDSPVYKLASLLRRGELSSDHQP